MTRHDAKTTACIHCQQPRGRSGGACAALSEPGYLNGCEYPTAELDPSKQAAHDADRAAVELRLAAAQATARGPVDPSVHRDHVRRDRRVRREHEGIRVELDGILRW